MHNNIVGIICSTCLRLYGLFYLNLSQQKQLFCFYHEDIIISYFRLYIKFHSTSSAMTIVLLAMYFVMMYLSIWTHECAQNYERCNCTRKRFAKQSMFCCAVNCTKRAPWLPAGRPGRVQRRSLDKQQAATAEQLQPPGFITVGSRHLHLRYPIRLNKFAWTSADTQLWPSHKHCHFWYCC